MRQDINVLGLIKGVEGYVFLYPDDRSAAAADTLARFAANPDLSFTWRDADVLGDRILEREQLWTNRLPLGDMP